MHACGLQSPPSYSLLEKDHEEDVRCFEVCLAQNSVGSKVLLGSGSVGCGQRPGQAGLPAPASAMEPVLSSSILLLLLLHPPPPPEPDSVTWTSVLGGRRSGQQLSEHPTSH